MIHNYFKEIDIGIFVISFLLIGAGIACQFSYGFHKKGDEHFIKQILWVFIGLIPFFICLKSRLANWKHISTSLYWTNISLLVFVLFFGHTAGGAQRWIEIGPITIQPSEFSKLICVITLSTFYAQHEQSIKESSTFWKGLLHIFLPLILVFKQPHLGATLVILMTWFIISLFAGIRKKYLFGTLSLAVLILASAFFIPGILKDYQKNRVYAMFANDEHGSDYQQLKSTIAFGSGGILGTGFLKGQQKEGHFIPEQHTDFVLSIIGEEFGLIGTGAVLILFAIFFYRCWLYLLYITEYFPRLIISGSITIFAFHTLSNIGMCLHLTPVVGLWLPFLSYGGSAIWLCLATTGLILNITQSTRTSIF